MFRLLLASSMLVLLATFGCAFEGGEDEPAGVGDEDGLDQLEAIAACDFLVRRPIGVDPYVYYRLESDCYPRRNLRVTTRLQRIVDGSWSLVETTTQTDNAGSRSFDDEVIFGGRAPCTGATYYRMRWSATNVDSGASESGISTVAWIDCR